MTARRNPAGWSAMENDMSTAHIPLTALILTLGCSTVDDPKGTALADDLCELSSMSWSQTYSNPCDESDAAICYDALTVIVEPMDVNLDEASLDLAFCLEGEVTAPAYSVTTTLAEAAASGLLDFAMTHGHLTADDGFEPCYGLTVGLDGSLDEILEFSEGSYWWKNGTKRVGLGESDDTGDEADDSDRQAFGAFQTDGESLVLDLAEGLATALGLGSTVNLPADTLNYWPDPECSVSPY